MRLLFNPKYLLLASLLTGCLTSAVAQKQEARVGGTFEKGRFIETMRKYAAKDTIIDREPTPDNGMPNAIKVKPLPPVYEGNGGKGFDIYRSQVDNMGIAVPDSSFMSNTPNAFKGKMLMTPAPKAESIQGGKPYLFRTPKSN